MPSANFVPVDFTQIIKLVARQTDLTASVKFGGPVNLHWRRGGTMVGLLPEHEVILISGRADHSAKPHELTIKFSRPTNWLVLQGQVKCKNGPPRSPETCTALQGGFVSSATELVLANNSEQLVLILIYGGVKRAVIGGSDTTVEISDREES